MGAGPVFASFAVCPFGVVAASSRCLRGVRSVASLIPCHADWRRGVCRAGKVDVRFAWQASDSGCIDALRKALAGGSAWQVWGNVRLDVGARAFRVAGVGLRMH